MRLFRVLAITLFALCCASLTFAAGQTVTLTFERAETAGISGMRPFWDRPVVLREDGLRERVTGDGPPDGARASWADDFHWNDTAANWTTAVTYGYQRPGAIVFDAVQRSLLLRFPDSAQKIADTVNKGYAIEKVELLLPFDGTEQAPLGYRRPSSSMLKRWSTLTPRWHAVAWLLRKPWCADDSYGPTFNAFINGAGYWKKFGAQDTEADRYPQQFGPAEISPLRNDRLDVTGVLTDPAYGTTLAERLTGMEDCGFLIHKQESADAHYATGAQPLPPAPDEECTGAIGGIGIFLKRPKLVVLLRKDAGAHKIDSLPAPPNFRELFGYLQEDQQGGVPSALMPGDEDFVALKARYRFHKPDGMPEWQWKHVQDLQAQDGNTPYFPDTEEEYAAWIDALLATPPCAWKSSAMLEQAALLASYGQALPAPVLDHWKLCWNAWLLPQGTSDAPGDIDYTQYRATPEVNADAALGALLGGHFLAEKNIEDAGRRGLEMFPLRLWCWSDGAAAAPDSAGAAHLLLAQKLVADFAPTTLDRMMGRSMLTKSLEEAASSYHPLLHRVIIPAGRPYPADLIGPQAELRAILHILSPAGTLSPVRKGYPTPGTVLSPAGITQASLAAPWTPGWVAGLIDHKPLPYEVTATCTHGEREWNAPRYTRSYLGHEYALASIDLDDADTMPALAQWRRTTAPTAGNEDLGTLILRDTNGTALPTRGAPPATAILQYHNKLVALNPYAVLDLFTAQRKPGWQLYVNEQPLTILPTQLKSSSRITIKDGVSYLGIIPIPTGEAELVLHAGAGPAGMKPALTIAWSLGQGGGRQETPAPLYGGFILEIADVSEYPQFADFQRHIRQYQLELNWD